MKKKVAMALVVLILVPTILAAPPAFKFGDDWWFETPSLVDTKYGWKFILTYEEDFNVSGKVLAATYFSQKQFMLSPVDIIVGWGDVVAPDNIGKIEILADTRAFYWRNRGTKLNDDYIASHILNIHVIPRSKPIADALFMLKVYDNINAKGKIVDVQAQSDEKSPAWQTTYLRTDAERGDSQIALINVLTINNMTYSEGGEVKSGKDIVSEQVNSMTSLILGVFAKYGIYFAVIIVGLLVLYLFNTLILRGYSAKKTDICVLTTEGRERSFEYLRAFENFGDDILIVLSHIRSKGPAERSELEKKYSKKPVEYLLKRGYLELKKG